MVIGEKKIPLDEAIAVAMMLGELPPEVCYHCKGSGMQIKLFGHGQCGFCYGKGFSHIDRKTYEYFFLEGRSRHD